MLSPIDAATLDAYLTMIVFESKLPESNVPIEPKVPIGIDHA